MRPAAGYVVRSTGCGRFLGIVFIATGLLVLLANSNIGLPARDTKYWPLLVIALGIFLLIRHYWQQYTNRSNVPAVIDQGTGGFGARQRNFAPPGLPVVIMALGFWRLAVNLHWTSTWVIVAIVLIGLGALFLGGSIRASIART